jgi:AcrR family transcriptional regulator
MKATLKLSREERKTAIVQAVRRAFAEKGFDGTTTRELAEAAGVSEALLFKHFPNKEALYSAMQLSYCNSQDPVIERLRAMEPSTSSLVALVHFLLSRKIGGRAVCGEDEEIHTRLMLRSLMEGGEFARLQLQQLTHGFVAKVEESLKAAVAAGDAYDGPRVLPGLSAWFAHHLAVALMHYLRPAQPVVDYKVPRSKLVEQAVWFTLRGMGLKEEAIKRHYNSKALELFLS